MRKIDDFGDRLIGDHALRREILQLRAEGAGLSGKAAGFDPDELAAVRPDGFLEGLVDGEIAVHAVQRGDQRGRYVQQPGLHLGRGARGLEPAAQPPGFGHGVAGVIQQYQRGAQEEEGCAAKNGFPIGQGHAFALTLIDDDGASLMPRYRVRARLNRAGD